MYPVPDPEDVKVFACPKSYPERRHANATANARAIMAALPSWLDDEALDLCVVDCSGLALLAGGSVAAAPLSGVLTAIAAELEVAAPVDTTLGTALDGVLTAVVPPTFLNTVGSLVALITATGWEPSRKPMFAMIA